MNKIILMGRLTADPELKTTQSGIASCKFTVAVNRRFSDKNTGERQADFITCTAWRKTAEFITTYFKKGSMICIDGDLRTGKYTDRNHPDVTHYTAEVFVDNVEFAGSKNSNETSEDRQQYNTNSQNTGNASLEDFEEILNDGDVPF